MTFRLYIRFLALCYFVGFALHALDLFGARLDFQKMNTLWKAWTLSLLCADLLAALGLWLRTRWGIGLFFTIASSQLVAYIGFSRVFGNQSFLIGFHLITVGLFLVLAWRNGKPVVQLPSRSPGSLRNIDKPIE